MRGVLGLSTAGVPAGGNNLDELFEFCINHAVAAGLVQPGQKVALVHGSFYDEAAGLDESNVV